MLGGGGAKKLIILDTRLIWKSNLNLILMRRGVKNRKKCPKQSIIPKQSSSSYSETLEQIIEKRLSEIVPDDNENHLYRYAYFLSFIMQ